jgi:hypothetical protein
MEGSCSTGQSPQQAVVPVEEEEESMMPREGVEAQIRIFLTSELEAATFTLRSLNPDR